MRVFYTICYLFICARPKIQMIIMGKVLAGCLLAYSYFHNYISLKLVRVLLGVLSFMMMSISVYLTNAYADIEIDSINKPYRPQVNGKISRKYLKYSSITFGLLSLVFANFISKYFIFALVFALIIGTAYSIGPFKLKRHYLGIFLTMAVGGSISYIAGWVLISSIFIKHIYCDF